MKSLLSSPKPANLRDSFHQHLHLYALAASAAGVSVLALAQPGKAEIIYTPANVTIGLNQQYGLDLNNDGIVDFTIKGHGRYFPPITYRWSLYVNRPPKGNEVAAHLAFGGYQLGGVHHFAYALSSGMPINQQAVHFSNGKAIMSWGCECDAGGFSGGSWLSLNGQGRTNRYLGFKFEINGQVHYGWARMNAGFGGVLTGYAYETVPNQGLNAGQTQEAVEQKNPAAVTQPNQNPATLGVLARGASGLPAQRRMQPAAAGK